MNSYHHDFTWINSLIIFRLAVYFYLFVWIFFRFQFQKASAFNWMNHIFCCVNGSFNWLAFFLVWQSEIQIAVISIDCCARNWFSFISRKMLNSSKNIGNKLNHAVIQLSLMPSLTDDVVWQWLTRLGSLWLFHQQCFSISWFEGCSCCLKLLMYFWYEIRPAWIDCLVINAVFEVLASFGNWHVNGL